MDFPGGEISEVWVPVGRRESSHYPDLFEKGRQDVHRLHELHIEMTQIADNLDQSGVDPLRGACDEVIIQHPELDRTGILGSTLSKNLVGGRKVKILGPEEVELTIPDEVEEAGSGATSKVYRFVLSGDSPLAIKVFYGGFRTDEDRRLGSIPSNMKDVLVPGLISQSYPGLYDCFVNPRFAVIRPTPEVNGEEVSCAAIVMDDTKGDDFVPFYELVKNSDRRLLLQVCRDFVQHAKACSELGMTAAGDIKGADFFYRASSKRGVRLDYNRYKSLFRRASDGYLVDRDGLFHAMTREGQLQVNGALGLSNSGSDVWKQEHPLHDLAEKIAAEKVLYSTSEMLKDIELALNGEVITSEQRSPDLSAVFRIISDEKRRRLIFSDDIGVFHSLSGARISYISYLETRAGETDIEKYTLEQLNRFSREVGVELMPIELLNFIKQKIVLGAIAGFVLQEAREVDLTQDEQASLEHITAWVGGVIEELTLMYPKVSIEDDADRDVLEPDVSSSGVADSKFYSDEAMRLDIAEGGQEVTTEQDVNSDSDRDDGVRGEMNLEQVTHPNQDLGEPGEEIGEPDVYEDLSPTQELESDYKEALELIQQMLMAKGEDEIEQLLPQYLEMVRNFIIKIKNYGSDISEATPINGESLSSAKFELIYSLFNYMNIMPPLNQLPIGSPNLALSNFTEIVNSLEIVGTYPDWRRVYPGDSNLAQLRKLFLAYNKLPETGSTESGEYQIAFSQSKELYEDFLQGFKDEMGI